MNTDLENRKEDFDNCYRRTYGCYPEDEDYQCGVSAYQKAFEDIRAEINEKIDGGSHSDEFIDGYENGLTDVLEIIDRNDPSKAGKEKE